MRRDNLFKDETLTKIQKIRKIFLKSAVWIMIAELALGAVLILTGGWDITIGRIQGTFLILALVLFLGVNSFIRLEKGSKTIQAFALVGFIGSLLFATLACLLMWEIVPSYWMEEVTRTSSYGGLTYSSTEPHMTFWMIIMLIASYATAGGFWISNILSIKETIKLVKPLKITAIVCVVYLWIFGTIMTPFEPEFQDVEKLYQLSGLAGLAFVITALAALIISNTNGKKLNEANTSTDQIQNKPKTDAELRAEIEEKIRREMIEKEIRARIAAEQSVEASPDNPADDTTDTPDNIASTSDYITGVSGDANSSTDTSGATNSPTDTSGPVA